MSMLRQVRRRTRLLGRLFHGQRAAESRPDRGSRRLAGAAGAAVESLEQRTFFGFGLNQATNSPPLTSAGPPDCCPDSGPSQPAAADFNPGLNNGVEGLPSIHSTAPVDYFTGKPTVTATDLESGGFGRNWGVGRTWVGLDDSGRTGNGWLNTSLPYLVLRRNQYSPVHGAVVTVIDAGNTQRLFHGTLDDTSMQPMYDVQDHLTYVPPTTSTVGSTTTYLPGEFHLVDAKGDTTVFYDLPRDSDGQVNVAGTSDTVGRLYNDSYYAQEPTTQRQVDGDSNAASSAYPFGAFKSFTDAAGNTTSTVYDSGGNLQEVDRSDPSGAQERFYYEYATVSNSLGGSASLVSKISLQRRPDPSAAWATVRWVKYTYYTGETSPGAPDPNGRLGDLKLAQTGQTVGGTDAVLDTAYYRYYKFYTNSWNTAAAPTDDPATTGGGDSTFSSLSSLPCVYSGLKSIVQGTSYARLAAAVGSQGSIDALSDAALQPYADNTFQYESYSENSIQYGNDPSADHTRYRVTSETAGAAGCSCTGVGGVGTYTYTYVHPPYALPGTQDDTLDGANTWCEKTIVSLPSDSEVHDQEVVYLNQIGEVMLSVKVDGATGQALPTYYRYDGQGRVILQADPSAMAPYNPADPSAYEQFRDLVNFDTADGNLSTHSGRVELSTYATTTTATTTTSGDVAGYLQSRAVEQGYDLSATPTLVSSQTYIERDGTNGTVYPVAAQTVYGAADGGDPRTTNYSYTWLGPTTQMASVTRTDPTLTADQNGPGTPDTGRTIFDGYGRPVWTVDGDGYVTYTRYDPGTGAVVETIDDADPAAVPAPPVAGPVRSASLPPALNLTTTYQVDGLGRTTKLTSPSGRVAYTVYNDAAHEVRVYPGWTGASTTGPIQVVREYRPAPGAGGFVYTETLTTSATPHTTGGAPDGTEAIDGSNIQSLGRAFANDGGQLRWSDSYFSTAGLVAGWYTQSVAADGAGNPIDLGAAGSNFYRTTYGYDDRGRRDKVLLPTGTIDRTVFDGFGRPVGSWVGTSDTGATFQDPTGGGAAGNNMVRTEAEQYDNGGAGDSDLTQATLYPGGSQAPRITRAYYDWRDRPVAAKSGVVLNPDNSENLSAENDGTNRPIEFTTYDNLGEPVETDAYTGDGVAVSTSNGEVNAPDPTLLRANVVTAYDDRGRPYRTQAFSVDPSSGAVGSALTSDTFYDHRGDAVATYTGGGGASKSAYDGAGRVVSSYATDGGAVNNGGSPLLDWADANSVTNDVVTSQGQTLYDGDGNVTETVTSDRLPGDPVTAAGALGDHTGSGGPAARVSYAGTWYDAADRPTATEDVGTNGGSAWTRPASPDARDDTHLVTGTTYNPMGLPDTVTDPRGVASKTTYDLLGRTTATIAAYTGGTPTNSTDQTTTYAYDGDNHLTGQTAVMPAGTPGQTTAYVYGVTAASGSTISSNDLLAKVEYPDKTTGAASPAASDDVSGTYDALGEPLTGTDQNGTTHAFGYDLLGRQTGDAVTALGAGVDGTVRLHTISYNTQGQVYQLTAYASPTGGAVLNQVQDVYNGVGQPIGEYQSHSGPVDTSSTPQVRYAYSDPSTGSRQSGLTYPNGRVLSIGYGGSALDSAVGRVDSLADAAGPSAGPLADYQYLGSGTVVSQANGNGVSLSYLQQPGDTQAVSDGRDQVTGLDRFGRVIDQDYVNTATGASTDRFQYGYDRDSNVLYKNNLLNGSWSELYHANSTSSGDNNSAYDPLNRLTAFSRGALSASGDNGSSLDTIPGSRGHLTVPETWGLDALGNWDSSGRAGATARTHDSRNEVTSITAFNHVIGSPAYDAAGDTTTDEQGRKLTYDAWGQVVAVRDASSNPIAAYTTDAAGRRISQATGSGPATDLYYGNNGNVLEERQGSTVTGQYVWGVTYVNDLLLRDDSSTTGSLGVADSGLGRRLYAQHDADYNVTALTDASGNVVERFAYDPYGAVTVLTPSWSAGTDVTGWAYLFQGMRLDPATGLYHTPNREYSPTLGRWMQMDRAGYVDGMNLYQALRSHPLNGTDPTGHGFWSGAAGALAGLGTAVLAVTAVAAVVSTAPVSVPLLLTAAALGTAAGAYVGATTTDDPWQGAVSGAQAGPVAGLAAPYALEAFATGQRIVLRPPIDPEDEPQLSCPTELNTASSDLAAGGSKLTADERKAILDTLTVNAPQLPTGALQVQVQMPGAGNTMMNSIYNPVTGNLHVQGYQVDPNFQGNYLSTDLFRSSINEVQGINGVATITGNPKLANETTLLGANGLPDPCLAGSTPWGKALDQLGYDTQLDAQGNFISRPK